MEKENGGSLLPLFLWTVLVITVYEVNTMKTSAQSIFNFRLQSIVRQVICTSLIFVLFFIQSTPVNAIGTRVGGSITDWDQVPNDQKILWAADHLERVLIDEGYFGQYVKVLTQEGHYAETTAHGENGVVDVPLVSLEDDWTHDPIFGQFMSFTVYAYSDFVVFSVYTGEETIGYHWKYDWEGNRLPYTDVNALDTLARDLTIGEFVSWSHR